ERGAMGAQQRVDVVREPARMPELEGMPPGRERRECAREPVVVPMEPLRKLPEYRAELRRPDERADRLVKARDAVGEITQPVDVREIGSPSPRRRSQRGSPRPSARRRTAGGAGRTSR